MHTDEEKGFRWLNGPPHGSGNKKHRMRYFGKQKNFLVGLLETVFGRRQFGAKKLFMGHMPCISPVISGVLSLVPHLRFRASQLPFKVMVSERRGSKERGARKQSRKRIATRQAPLNRSRWRNGASRSQGVACHVTVALHIGQKNPPLKIQPTPIV